MQVASCFTFMTPGLLARLAERGRRRSGARASPAYGFDGRMSCTRRLRPGAPRKGVAYSEKSATHFCRLRSFIREQKLDLEMQLPAGGIVRSHHVVQGLGAN